MRVMFSRINRLLQDLRDKENTVFVVEHDPDVIAIADEVIDIGPLAGKQGGEIIFSWRLSSSTSIRQPNGKRNLSDNYPSILSLAAWHEKMNNQRSEFTQFKK